MAESASSWSVVRDAAKKWPTSAEEFDRTFDDGEDIDHLIDWSSARQVNAPMKRVNVDFPAWMVERLDREAKRRGVPRQALIKMWLADRLETAR
jgi:guanylate kinase